MNEKVFEEGNCEKVSVLGRLKCRGNVNNKNNEGKNKFKQCIYIGKGQFPCDVGRFWGKDQNILKDLHLVWDKVT